MYNRYIPQPDGSHRRNRVPDPSRQEPPRHRPAQPPCPPPEPICDPPDEIPCAPPPRPVPPPKAGGRRPSRPKEPESISGFLKKLLPKDLDTGDLLIILLLLIMAGDCEEDKNNTLLTLALYFLL